MGSDVKSHTSPPVHTEHKTAAVRLSRCHARCYRASHRFSLCLTTCDYFQLKITCSKVLEELAGFPMPRSSTDFLCQFKVILSNELALVQTTRTLMGSLTLPALLMAASGAQCQYMLRSQRRVLSSGKRKPINIAKLSKRTSPTLAGIIKAFAKHAFVAQNT